MQNSIEVQNITQKQHKVNLYTAEKQILHKLNVNSNYTIFVSMHWFHCIESVQTVGYYFSDSVKCNGKKYSNE